MESSLTMIGTQYVMVLNTGLLDFSIFLKNNRIKSLLFDSLFVMFSRLSREYLL